MLDTELLRWHLNKTTEIKAGMSKRLDLYWPQKFQQKEDQEWTNGGASHILETSEWTRPDIRKQKCWKPWWPEMFQVIVVMWTCKLTNIIYFNIFKQNQCQTSEWNLHLKFGNYLIILLINFKMSYNAFLLTQQIWPMHYTFQCLSYIGTTISERRHKIVCRTHQDF